MAIPTEQRCIHFGDVCVTYTLERKRIKNVNLRLRPENGLVVSAPLRVSVRQIEQILQQHERQILTTLHAYAAQKQEKRQQYPLSYETGETVLYLGKYYHLEVLHGAADCVQLAGEQLHLVVTEPSDELRRKNTFDTWWNTTCETSLRNLCRAVFPIYEAHGIAFPTIRFRPMVAQWGNCRPQRGVLTFNTRLLAAPVRCMEYVVIHEFTHFLFPDHSKPFYQFIEQELPDWRSLQETLQKSVETRDFFEKKEKQIPNN